MDIKKQNLIEYETKSIKDYINIIRTHLLKVVLISMLILALSIVYAVTAKNVYRAVTVLKITPPEGSILDPMAQFGEIGDRAADRFLLNEIETMKNVTIREQVAQKIVEASGVIDDVEKLSLFVQEDEYFEDNNVSVLPPKVITQYLEAGVEIIQKEGLDFIEISAESPSPYEAALIVNTYANVYGNFNLLDNRKQVSAVKDFLKIQKDEKYNELLEVEEQYKEYQMKGKALVLDQQATSLIGSIAGLESQKNTLAIEMSISKKALDQYTTELEKRDLSVSKYLESKAGEPYLELLQQQIAQLEANRDLAMSSGSAQNNNAALIEKYNNDLASLKEKLQDRTDEYRASILTASPEEIRGLSQQIFEEDVKYKSLAASYDQIENQLKTYEKRFDNLPKATVGLARLERARLSAEQLYVRLEEKYQEALLNEQATTGNVLVLSYAREPEKPAKPNRKIIIFMGLILGLIGGIGYAVTMTYFDKTVKSPEDVEELNIDLLGWIPQIEDFGTNGKFSEFFVANHSNTISTDSFKFLRTTLSYSKEEGVAKSLLITSSAPSEGKSVISSNLAGSYAIAKKKTLLIDCDLRKPRVHTIFNKKRVPGLVDYLYGKATYEDIISLTEVKGLSIIPVGTIPQNPTEFLDSSGMKSFLNRVKQEFEVVIIDSPPLTTLADAVILSRLVDETILVASSGVTDNELLRKSVDQLKRVEGSTFKGVLLNKFNLKKNYGSYYYKYANHYARDTEPKRGKRQKT